MKVRKAARHSLAFVFKVTVEGTNANEVISAVRAIGGIGEARAADLLSVVIRDRPYALPLGFALVWNEKEGGVLITIQQFEREYEVVNDGLTGDKGCSKGENCSGKVEVLENKIKALEREIEALTTCLAKQGAAVEILFERLDKLSNVKDNGGSGVGSHAKSEPEVVSGSRDKRRKS